MSRQLESILGKVTTATPEPKPLPQKPPRTEAERLLQAKVPAEVARAVGLRAKQWDATTRTVILRGLKSIGIDVPDEELCDRRRGPHP